MRCIAVDDEPLALKLLTRYCEKIPSIELLGAYTDPMDALSYIRSLSPDLLFLDIHMPDLSGIEIVRYFADYKPLVIFTTAHKEHAIEGFELDVVDYLLKPFRFERFQKACRKAEERYRSNQLPEPENSLSEESITFKNNYQTVCLPVDSIQYIEASNNNIRIVTPNQVYTPLMTMKSIWDFLPEGKFVRIHKSYILPVNKIRSFNSEKVITEAIQAPIGRAYLKAFVEKLKKKS